LGGGKKMKTIQEIFDDAKEKHHVFLEMYDRAYPKKDEIVGAVKGNALGGIEAYEKGLEAIDKEYYDGKKGFSISYYNECKIWSDAQDKMIRQMLEALGEYKGKVLEHGYWSYGGDNGFISDHYKTHKAFSDVANAIAKFIDGTKIVNGQEKRKDEFKKYFGIDEISNDLIGLLKLGVQVHKKNDYGPGKYVKETDLGFYNQVRKEFHEELKINDKYAFVRETLHICKGDKLDHSLSGYSYYKVNLFDKIVPVTFYAISSWLDDSNYHYRNDYNSNKETKTPAKLALNYMKALDQFREVLPEITLLELEDTIKEMYFMTRFIDVMKKRY